MTRILEKAVDDLSWGARNLIVGGEAHYAPLN